MVIRFRLKTLLVFAVVIGIATVAWTLIPQSHWMIRNGNLEIYSFGHTSEPITSDNWVDVGIRIQTIPLWAIALAAIACIVSFVGGVIFAGKRQSK